MLLKNEGRRRWLFLIVGVLFALVAVRHYGESWDELKFYKYAEDALRAYPAWPQTGTIPETGNTYDNYGPAYVMFVSVGARLLGQALPWLTSDLRHLLYFVTFLVGCLAFYELCKRWLSPTGALSAALLFGSQPLFWGHAFISPKDIPFLTFFVLSVFFGLKMVDSFESPSLENLQASTRRRLLVFGLAWLVFLIVFFGGTAIWHGWLAASVRAAAAGQDNLIARLASDVQTADPQVYIQRYFVFFLWARAIVFWISTAILAWYVVRQLPAASRLLQIVAPAAAVLGLTTCIRILGPLAGVLVALYALRRHGKNAPVLLGPYFFLAFLVMYATWPYLWPDPIGRFVESVVVMAKYPWQGQVLFHGALYDSADIPRSYLPVLLAIQLTEPVWALSAAGLAVTILGAVRKRNESMQLLALTSIWLLLPLAAFVALRSPLYDNFRQIFFILPPVFMLIGAIVDRIKPPLWQGALVAVAILPGVLAGVRLHPYEYIYYNSFAGGVHGAFRRFELDYWGTSYREAAAYLNEHAPAGAAVWVEGPAHLLDLYARPDLRLYSTYEEERADEYDYVVATSRYALDFTSYPDAPVVYTIERDGAILTVIKQP